VDAGAGGPDEQSPDEQSPDEQSRDEQSPDDLDLVADDEADGDSEDDDEDGAPSDGEEAPAEVDLADLEQESEIRRRLCRGPAGRGRPRRRHRHGRRERPGPGVRGRCDLQELIGPNGESWKALQELTRLAVHGRPGPAPGSCSTGRIPARRRVELTEVGQDAAEEVKTSGTPRRLDAMTPFERKSCTDAVAAAGLRSESEARSRTAGGRLPVG